MNDFRNPNFRKKPDAPPEKKYQSSNMSYIFQVEYFENLAKWRSEGNSKDVKQEVGIYNKGIENFCFKETSPVSMWREIDGYQNFQLVTCYPGLLIGTGNPHEISVASAIKCGFAFDAVTGYPYIPGSSLKGMLRSCFPGDNKETSISKEYEEYLLMHIREIKKDNRNEGKWNIEALKSHIFENGDIFLGAFPSERSVGSSMLAMEYITPHKKFANPVPISLIKVKPEVQFEFGFILKDYVADGAVVFSAKEKLELFKRLILDMGIGAKTNVGFGKFREGNPKRNVNTR